jgi:hypothetical protein
VGALHTKEGRVLKHPSIQVSKTFWFEFYKLLLTPYGGQPNSSNSSLWDGF